MRTETVQPLGHMTQATSFAVDTTLIDGSDQG